MCCIVPNLNYIFVNMNTENARAQMRKGVLELCVLRVVRKGEAYTSDLSAALKQADLLVVEGTLYPFAHPPEKCGMVGVSLGRVQVGPSPEVLQADPQWGTPP